MPSSAQSIDEIIFRTVKPRNRIMLELMAKGGMRIGEVLKIRPADVKDRKITLRCLQLLTHIPERHSLMACPLRIHTSCSGLAAIYWGCSINGRLDEKGEFA
jgi:integrase